MRFLLLPLLLCAACARPPDLDEHITPAAKAAPFPALVPLGPLLDEADGTRISTTDAALQARAAALRARARQMQDESQE